MEINRNNYENYFLLYVDHELNASEMKSVDSFLDSNPDLRKEFILLQQTVLLPTDLVFENKSLLFRKEEKKRIVPIFWIRMAAAISVLILGSWFMISQLTKTSPGTTNAEPDQMQAQVNKEAEVKKQESDSKVDLALQPQTKLAEATLQKNSLVKKTSVGQTTAKNVQRSSSEKVQTASTDISANVKPEDDEPVIIAKKSNPDLIIETNEKPNAADTKNMTVNTDMKSPILVLASENVTAAAADYAMYKETDSQNDNAISILALNEKNKALTGFFKKLTKRTPADENTKKLRVSVFQFSY